MDDGRDPVEQLLDAVECRDVRPGDEVAPGVRLGAVAVRSESTRSESLRSAFERAESWARDRDDLAAILYHRFAWFRLGGGWTHASARAQRRYRAIAEDAMLGLGVTPPPRS